MTLPRHNPAVFYSAAGGFSPTAFVILVVIPLVVLGLIMWWAHEPKKPS